MHPVQRRALGLVHGRGVAVIEVAVGRRLDHYRRAVAPPVPVQPHAQTPGRSRLDGGQHPVLHPQRPVVLQEQHPVAGGEQALAPLGHEPRLRPQRARVLQRGTRQRVQGENVGVGLRQDQRFHRPAIRLHRQMVGQPRRDQRVARRLSRRREPDHPGRVVDGQCLGDKTPCQRYARPAMRRVGLPPDLRQFDVADDLGQRPEPRPRLDRLELGRVAHQHQLRPPPFHLRHDPRELFGGHHSGLVQHEHVPRPEPVALVLPGQLPRGQRARADPGAAFQSLRRLARQSPADDPIPRRLPRRAGRPEHRRLARPGKPHHRRDPLGAGDVLDRLTLLLRETRMRRKRPKLAGPRGPVAAGIRQPSGRRLHRQFRPQQRARRVPRLRQHPPALRVERLADHRHQFRRLPKPQTHRLEHRRIVDVAEHRPGDVARVEHRLLPRQQRQQKLRIGDDRRRVARPALALRLDPIGHRPAPVHAHRAHADMRGRLQRDPGLRVRAVVDP